MNVKKPTGQSGFTIIEMIIALFIGGILLSGLYINFWVDSKIETTQIQYTERLQDLRLAAQIMANTLRLSACNDVADASAPVNIVRYKNLDGDCTTAFTTAGGAPAADTGSFEFRTVSPTVPHICWNRPNDGTNCQELIRGLDATAGLSIVKSSNVLQATLTASYLGNNRQQLPMQIEFRVWPRN